MDLLKMLFDKVRHLDHYQMVPAPRQGSRPSMLNSSIIFRVGQARMVRRTVSRRTTINSVPPLMVRCLTAMRSVLHDLVRAHLSTSHTRPTVCSPTVLLAGTTFLRALDVDRLHHITPTLSDLQALVCPVASRIFQLLLHRPAAAWIAHLPTHLRRVPLL